MNIDLEDEHAQLLQFMYACPIGLAEIKRDGTLSLVNPLAMQLLMPIDRTRGLSNFFSIVEPYAPELRNLTDEFQAELGTVFDGHRIFISPASKEGNFQAKVLACTMVKLNVNRYLITIGDVSKQVGQERRLKHVETWFASLVDSVNDFAVVSLDADCRIDGVNASMARQTGFGEADVLGRTLDMFDVAEPGSGMPTMSEQISLARRDGWSLNECWQSRRGGPPYWCQRLIAVRSEAEGPEGRTILGYTVVLRAVTQQQSDTVKLTQMLWRDHLTGAYNRAYFFEAAERECARALRYRQTLSLVSMDLDHFKLVNDGRGHAAGDTVLQTVVATCLRLLRPSDTFARLGGEEFSVLLPSTDLQRAVHFAERLRESISQTGIAVNTDVLHITASFGCAEFKTQAGTLSELLLAADKALYEAKEAGRDRVVFSRRNVADVEAQ